MPYVNVKTAGSLTKDQKEAIAKGICEVLQKEAQKSPKSVYVVFDEVDRENWAVGDKLLA